MTSFMNSPLELIGEAEEQYQTKVERLEDQTDRGGGRRNPIVEIQEQGHHTKTLQGCGDPDSVSADLLLYFSNNFKSEREVVHHGGSSSK